jgi:hypothetical protein
MIKQEEQTIAEIVREYLRDCHPGGVTLQVLEDEIQKIDYWWRVPVRPNVEPLHTFEYYDALAVVEGKIQDDRQLNVILVPAEPVEESEDVD